MKHPRGPEGLRRRGLFTSAILEGQPWVGRHISNRCLRRHCHLLGRNFQTASEEVQRLRPGCHRLLAVLESRSRILTELHPKDWPIIPAVVRLAAYETSWLRTPEDWTPPAEGSAIDQWHHFVAHLFARYPVPSCLREAWFRRGPLEHLERDCYCAVAAGKSIRGVAGIPSSITHRVLHEALQRSNAHRLPEAIWRAQLKVLGGSEALAHQVMACTVVSDLPNHARWRRLVEKFIPVAGNPSDFGLVADALVMVAALQGTSRVESLLRLPLSDLRRFSRRHWQTLLKANHDCFPRSGLYNPEIRRALRMLVSRTWPPLLEEEWRLRLTGSDPENYVEWRMVELCSHAELISEGRIMHHCVADYSKQCLSGYYAIFSLRRREVTGSITQEDRHVTILVSRCRRDIAQMRGPGNRRVTLSERTLIWHWSRANNVRMSCWC